MDAKLNKQRLAWGLELVRKHLLEIDTTVEATHGDAADLAVRKIRHRIGPKPIDGDRRERLIGQRAALKSRRRGDQALSHWLEDEAGVDLILRSLHPPG